MAQVKFYRGLATAYTQSATTNPTIKEGIYFSMDEKVIYHNGVKFGGIDPQYFEGITRNFDIEGSQVRFQKLDENGAWQDVTINLVAAADKSIVIGNLVNGNVTDGFTVKVNVKDVANEDGLKLGKDGLYVDFTKANEAIKANKDAIGVLNGADTVVGSVAKSVKDAVEALNAPEVGGTGKVITTISETDGVIAATAIDLAAENVAATAIKASDETVAVEGTNVKAQVESLAQSIKSVSSAAKSYSISAINSGLETNVKEAYKLVDEDGIQAGETIKIYKDSSLKTVELVGQELKFTYILADGSENTVGVDVSTFLAESEFKNGLEVVDHVVNVKIDGTSEKFLTVGAAGVKVSGVQDAIDKAAAQATTKVEKAADTDKITLASATAADGSVTYTIGQNDIASAAILGTAADGKDADTAFGKIAKEVADRKADIQAQTDALNAEIAARKKVDGISGDAYAAKANANYISEATSLFDADVKLDAAIKTVATALNKETNDRSAGDTALSNRLGDGVTASSTATAQLQALSGTSSDTSDATSVIGAKKYADAKIDKAVKGLDVDAIGGDRKVITTVSQNDGKISAEAINLTAESVAATAIEASDDFVAVEGANVKAQVESLAKSIKSVADTLLWIDCGNYQA